MGKKDDSRHDDQTESTSSSNDSTPPKQERRRRHQRGLYKHTLSGPFMQHPMQFEHPGFAFQPQQLLGAQHSWPAPPSAMHVQEVQNPYASHNHHHTTTTWAAPPQPRSQPHHLAQHQPLLPFPVPHLTSPGFPDVQPDNVTLLVPTTSPTGPALQPSFLPTATQPAPGAFSLQPDGQSTSSFEQLSYPGSYSSSTYSMPSSHANTVSHGSHASHVTQPYTHVNQGPISHGTHAAHAEDARYIPGTQPPLPIIPLPVNLLHNSRSASPPGNHQPWPTSSYPPALTQGPPHTSHPQQAHPISAHSACVAHPMYVPCAPHHHASFAPQQAPHHAPPARSHAPQPPQAVHAQHAAHTSQLYDVSTGLVLEVNPGNAGVLHELAAAGHVLQPVESMCCQRVAELQALLNGDVLAQRTRIMNQQARLSLRMGEVRAAAAALAQQTRSILSDILDRLSAAEESKIGELSRQQAILSGELVALEEVVSKVVQACRTHHARPDGFLAVSEGLVQECQRVVSKVIPDDLSIPPDDLPNEARTLADLTQANATLSKLIRVKDAMIWQLLKERDDMGAKANQMATGFTTEIEAMDRHCAELQQRLNLSTPATPSPPPQQNQQYQVPVSGGQPGQPVAAQTPPSTLQPQLPDVHVHPRYTPAQSEL